MAAGPTNNAVALTSTGRRLHVDPEDARGRRLIEENGNLNPVSVSLWCTLLGLSEWDLVVDVGASYGEMLVVEELARAGTVAAFEPNAAVRECLKRTVEDLPWAVTVRSEAVGSQAAQGVLFSVATASSGTSTLRVDAVDTAAVESVNREVDVTTLDAAFCGSGHRSACIKIDVEGEELSVLRGANALLAELERVVVMFEILHLPIEELAAIARKHAVYLFEPHSGRLVRVYGRDREELGRLVHSGRYSRQDAVLVAGRDQRALSRELERKPLGRSPERVVYTALFGQYEDLREQPVAANSDVRFVCFTDNPSLASDSWEVRFVEPAFRHDSVRSARKVKIEGHPELRQFEETLWVDNRVTLRRDPSDIFDDLLEGADIALFEHSFRQQVIDEFDAVVRGGYDDPSRVYEQLMHYAESRPSVLEQKPLWTGIIARRMTEEVREAMRVWSDHVLRYSRRDQLSVNFALASCDAPVRRLTGDNRESDHHAWPPIDVSLNRDKDGARNAFVNAIRAPLARLREIEREHVELLEAYRVSAEKRDRLLNRWQSEAASLQQQNKALRKQIRDQDRVLAEVRAALRQKEMRIKRLRRRVNRLAPPHAPARSGARASKGGMSRTAEHFAKRQVARVLRRLPSATRPR